MDPDDLWTVEFDADYSIITDAPIPGTRVPCAAAPRNNPTATLEDFTGRPLPDGRMAYRFPDERFAKFVVAEQNMRLDQ